MHPILKKTIAAAALAAASISTLGAVPAQAATSCSWFSPAGPADHECEDQDHVRIAQNRVTADVNVFWYDDDDGGRHAKTVGDLNVDFLQAGRGTLEIRYYDASYNQLGGTYTRTVNSESGDNHDPISFEQADNSVHRVRIRLTTNRLFGGTDTTTRWARFGGT